MAIDSLNQVSNEQLLAMSMLGNGQSQLVMQIMPQNFVTKVMGYYRNGV